MEEGGALPQKQIQLGLSFTCLRYMSWLKGHLLFGTSHMIPFIVAGGVLLAISIALSGKGDVPSQGLLADIAKMGMAGLALFATILGGYIAFSIADKPSLAPAMIGTWIAVTQYNTGFLGAIVVGFLAGFIVRILKKISLPQNMVSLGAIFIYPLLGTFLTCGAVMWVIGDPISNAMGMLNQFLEELAGSGKFILGAALGSMTAFDMGGPINKVATLFAQTQVSTQPWLMGGVGIAICTPPLGMALATILAPSRFKADEREAGKAAWIMGMIGISEGAIPFAASDPGRVLPAIVMGGVVGNITGFAFEVINHAPWGGWIVLPVVEGKIGYIVGIVVGSFVTASIVILLKRKLVQESDVSEQVDYPDSLAVEGQAELVAVTACPSGVAHTYLAAQSLEKAAKKHGVRIKIETQGANGTSNCLTDNDIQNARLVILAHDVAINNSRRFDDLRVIDVGTREAIYNADMLVKSL
jgi:fructose-specific PTS system IIC-like component